MQAYNSADIPLPFLSTSRIDFYLFWGETFDIDHDFLRYIVFCFLDFKQFED